MKNPSKQIARGALLLGATLGMGSALAQSQVTIYGIIDTGVEYVNNASATGGSVVKVPSLTGTFPSRFGFRGTEDLGDGLSAIFTLESGFSPDTGAIGQGNRQYGRQAFVGLKGKFGTVTLGRLLNMTYIASYKADVMGPNIHGVSNGDPYLPNARSDNAIGYLGTFSGVTVGGTYSFGRDASSAGGPAATNCAGEVAGNAKACRQWTTLLEYDQPGYGVATAYDILYGNTGAAGGLTSSNYSDRRVTLNGYFMVSQLKVGLGGIDRKTRAATESGTKIYYAGISYPISPLLALDTQLSRLSVNDTPKKSTLLAARLTYNLSKRTALYTSLGYMRNEGGAAIPVDAGGAVGAGLNQTGLMTGVRHTF